MPTAEDENLKVFYRSLTTEDLLLYRASLGNDEAVVRAPFAKQAIAFRAHRRRLVAEILTERGVEALN